MNEQPRRASVTPATLARVNTTEPGAVLHCRRCGADYSANAGDYFNRAPDSVFRCSNGHRAVNLILAVPYSGHRAVQS